jgi:hypothetical protein
MSNPSINNDKESVEIIHIASVSYAGFSKKKVLKGDSIRITLNIDINLMDLEKFINILNIH